MLIKRQMKEMWRKLRLALRQDLHQFLLLMQQCILSLANCLLFPSLLRFCGEFCGLEDDDVGCLHTVNLAFLELTTSPYPQVEYNHVFAPMPT